MSVPPLLVTRYRNGSAQVGRLLGGVTFAQIGSNLPVGAENVLTIGAMTTARAVQFLGKIYAYQRNKVYQFDDSPTVNDWVEVHSVTNQQVQITGIHSGLHVVQISSVPTLVAVYRTNAPQDKLSAIHSVDGVTWVNYDTAHTSDSTNYIGRSLVFRNDIYIHWNNAGLVGIVKYDTSANTATELTRDNLWVLGNTKDLCAFDGELYGLATNSSADGASFGLKKLVGSQFVTVHNFTTALHRTYTDSDVNAGHLLFTDGVNLYAFMTGREGPGNVIGTTAAKLVPDGIGGFTSTDITAVLPAGLAPPGGIATRWWSFMDNDTDPNKPRIYIWSQTPNGDSAYNAWKWNGPNIAMTNLGVGPATGIALPHTKDGGGEYIFTPNEPSIDIVDIEPSLDSQIISYIVYGDELTGGVRVRFWFDDDEIFAGIPVTLLSTTGGGTIGTDSVGDFVDDVVADGITVHTVEWDVVADGLARGDAVVVMPAIDL